MFCMTANFSGGDSLNNILIHFFYEKCFFHLRLLEQTKHSLKTFD